MTLIKKISIQVITLFMVLLLAGGCIAGEEQPEKDLVEGKQFDGWSNYPSISPDGRYVAYVTAGDPIPTLYQVRSPGDILIYDRETKETGSISNLSGLGEEYSSLTYPTLSYDGRYIAFEAIAPRPKDPYLYKDPVSHQIYLFDRLRGEARCVSVSSNGTSGNGRTNNPYITPDGRFITFSSWADDLVEGDTNGVEDIFLHDRTTGETERISVSTEGIQGDGGSFSPWLSSDGRWAVFGSGAGNLVSGDSNEKSDVFLHDRLTGETLLVSTPPGYSVPSVSPIISGDGNRVAFRSYSDNLPPEKVYPINIYLRDRRSNTIEQLTHYPDGTRQTGWSRPPAISEDGQFIAFESYGVLTPGDINEMTDVFVYDMQTKITTLVSLASDGTQGNAGSYSPDISFDGRHVTFVSEADNLVEGDINGYEDVFVHDRVTGRTTLISSVI